MGGAPECATPSDCEGMVTDCTELTCEEGMCGIGNVAEGTACTDNAGSVCDGLGECVGCTEDMHCEDDEVCMIESMTCAPAMCFNMQMDGSETDIDCGGPEAECPTRCEIGDMCSVFSDCLSRACVANVCSNCVTSADCQLATDYCDMDGNCVPRKPVGDACGDGLECETTFCVDGFCCENLCGAICRSCGLAGTEGTCSAQPDNTDPEMECFMADMCNGNFACRCGDGNMTAGEACDDGNNDSYDGCSALCRDPTDHLIISEVSIQPVARAFIEIYNPTSLAVSLTDVWVADFNTYYMVTSGMAVPGAGDFIARFPNGATIAADGYVTVSLSDAATFMAQHGMAPTHDNAAMGLPGGATLATASGMVVLFTWDNMPASPVQDLDYVIWGTSNASRVDKSGVAGYQMDTPVGTQLPAPLASPNSSITRCDTGEETETMANGNGVTNHDETSEDLGHAFRVLMMETPNGDPAPNNCDY